MSIHQSPVARPVDARTVGLTFAVGALVLGYRRRRAAQAQSPAAMDRPPPAGEAYTVNAVTDATGTYLTGEDGKTLYYFTKDTAPGASVCTGGCADNWPAFKLEGAETVAAGDGCHGRARHVPARRRHDAGQRTTAVRCTTSSVTPAAGTTAGQGIKRRLVRGLGRRHGAGASAPPRAGRR